MVTLGFVIGVDGVVQWRRGEGNWVAEGDLETL